MVPPASRRAGRRPGRVPDRRLLDRGQRRHNHSHGPDPRDGLHLEGLQGRRLRRRGRDRQHELHHRDRRHKPSHWGGAGPAARPAARPQPDPQPEFGSATVVNLAYQQGSPIDSLTLPEADGGEAVLTYALAPALPAGLNFDAATRTLSGTPTAGSPRPPYTYTATNAHGDRTTLTFTLTVEADLQPTFEAHTLGDQAYEQHQAIGTLQLPAATVATAR